MKVLLVCAAGMSTSILMKKLEKYAAANDIKFEIDAVGLGEYKEVCKNYDCILMGPQVGYRKDEVVAGSGIPVDVIKPQDYGIGNCANIFKQIAPVIKDDDAIDAILMGLENDMRNSVAVDTYKVLFVTGSEEIKQRLVESMQDFTGEDDITTSPAWARRSTSSPPPIPSTPSWRSPTR